MIPQQQQHEYNNFIDNNNLTSKNTCSNTLSNENNIFNADNNENNLNSYNFISNYVSLENNNDKESVHKSSNFGEKLIKKEDALDD